MFGPERKKEEKKMLELKTYSFAEIAAKAKSEGKEAV